ncbi:17245_t:CDS:1, partial [Funneliformis geosporum]
SDKDKSPFIILAKCCSLECIILAAKSLKPFVNLLVNILLGVDFGNL